MKLSVILTLLLFDIASGFPGRSMFTGTQLLFFNAFYGWGVLVYGLTYLNPAVIRQRHLLLREVSLAAGWQWLLRTLFDTLYAFLVSAFLLHDHPPISFFAQEISAQSFANWYLLMLITNLRISLDAGIAPADLQRHQWIHLSVALTIFIFSMVAIFPRLLAFSASYLSCLGTAAVLYIPLSCLLARFF
jgi:hypothetical protein